jgi:hypothetical protein
MIATQRKVKEAAEDVPGDAKTLREKSQETDTCSAPEGGARAPPAALETRSEATSPNRAKRRGEKPSPESSPGGHVLGVERTSCER